jgi:hypothetical protein
VIQLGIQLDAVQIARAQSMLREVPGGIKRAVIRAGNETIAEAKTQISKLVRQYINIKKRDVDRYIDVHHKMRWVSGHAEGKVVVLHDKRLGLQYFGARQTKQGVTVRIKPGGARTTIKAAFMPVAFALGGHVYGRRGPRKRPRVKKLKRTMKIDTKGRKTSYAWPDLPVVPLRGASVWGVMIKNDLLEPVREEMQRDFHKNLLQRVDAELLRHAGKIPPAKQAA